MMSKNWSPISRPAALRPRRQSRSPRQSAPTSMRSVRQRPTQRPIWTGRTGIRAAEGRCAIERFVLRWRINGPISARTTWFFWASRSGAMWRLPSSIRFSRRMIFLQDHRAVCDIRRQQPWTHGRSAAGQRVRECNRPGGPGAQWTAGPRRTGRLGGALGRLSAAPAPRMGAF